MRDFMTIDLISEPKIGLSQYYHFVWGRIAQKVMKNGFFWYYSKNIAYRPILSMEVEYKYGHCATFGTTCMSVSPLGKEIWIFF